MQFPSIPDEDSLDKGIDFAVIDVEFPSFDSTALSAWLSAVAKTYGKSVDSLLYILCSDAYLLDMNIERLNHDTYTDIITFDFGDSSSEVIEGECYISLERVKENAGLFNVTEAHELNRVFAHGLLHLCGLGDKTEEEAKTMREAEEFALGLLEA
jgi:rRNA maturation RNase YbeY